MAVFSFLFHVSIYLDLLNMSFILYFFYIFATNNNDYLRSSGGGVTLMGLARTKETSTSNTQTNTDFNIILIFV